MTPQQLRLVKTFWAKAEPLLASAIPDMYERFFALAPEARALFKGPLACQQAQFSEMLCGIVKLTRSSHLWPVSALTGQAVIPGLASLARQYAVAGVQVEHCHKIKHALVTTFTEKFPADFTEGVRDAFCLIFDVLAQSLVGVSVDREVNDSEQARFFGRKPASSGGSFADYMNPSPAR